MNKYFTLSVLLTACLFSTSSFAHPHEIGALGSEAQLAFVILLGACTVLAAVWLGKGRKHSAKRESLEQEQDKFDQE